MTTRARAMARRTVYDTDVYMDTKQFLDKHPFHKTVFHDGENILSVLVRWPLAYGMSETQDVIRIQKNVNNYAFFNDVDSATFPVYAWENSARTAHYRGIFRYTKSSTSLFTLDRIPTPSLGENTKKRALQIANDVYREVCTSRAVVRATEETAEAPTPVVPPPLIPTPVEPPPQIIPTPVAVPPPIIPTPVAVPSLFEIHKYNGYSRPTVYNNVTYRSLTEARFALVLDELKIPYSYESMVFNRPNGGRYTPDFFLPDQQLMIEIKPAYPLIEEEEKCEEMSSAGYRIVCMYGERIGVMPLGYEQKKRNYAHKDGMRGIAWHNGEKLPGIVTFVVGRSPKTPSPLEMMANTDAPHLDVVRSTSDRRWDSGIIRDALEKASLQT